MRLRLLAPLAPLILLGATRAQDDEAPPAPPSEPPPHAVELRSGTVLVGRIEPPSWKVATAFGELTVPVVEIRRVRFGRRAQPERLAKVEEAVQRLAAAEPERRNHARAAIVQEGTFAVPSLRAAAKTHDDPEVKRIAAEILKELDPDDEVVMPDDDQVDTARFSVLGQIQLEAFKVNVGELGPLVVKRGDVEGIRSAAPDSSRKITVAGTNCWPNGWLDTKIKVEKGERLKIQATGTIFFPNWGQAFTPDGNQNMGAMNGMMVGTLAARVGPKGTIFRIGSSFNGAMPAAGTLQLILNIQAPDQPHEGEFSLVLSRSAE
ncbi:MAG: hypothetical protein L6Q95_03200 [Planctomycetes bacterium]|nr:hypothetical protein [Planctomycetota bacterium]